jgi:hypothetical protein
MDMRTQMEVRIERNFRSPDGEGARPDVEDSFAIALGGESMETRPIEGRSVAAVT